jgi:dihydroxyacetone kinase
MGAAVRDADRPTAEHWVDAVTAARDVIGRLGKAQPGDKTMLDALVPFAESLGRSVRDGRGLGEAWPQAAAEATDAARRTADLLPRVGRARPHAERSLGSPDPGAVSLALAVTAVGAVLSDKEGGRP